MTTIALKQPHTLGLKKARMVALDWAQEAERKLAMSCEYEEGDTFDCVHFKRQGVTGSMFVRGKEFEINAKLGFLLSAFKDRIESEIIQNLQAKLQNQ